MKHLVIIIPAFNEEEGIGKILDGYPKDIQGIGKINIIVINDGSTDKTEEIAKNKGAHVISHPQNMGLGVSFRSGLAKALEMGADVIVNIDADGQFDIEEVPKLVNPILKGEAEFVTASRFISSDLAPSMPRVKSLGNKLMSSIVSRIIGKKFYDVSCGYRAYSRKAALHLNLFGKYTYTQETFIDLASKNIPIIEVPVKVKGEREFGKSKVASNLFKYGFNTLRIIMAAFRDYRPLRLMFFLSLILVVIGTLFGSFFLIHYIRVGAFRPHTWAGFLSFSSFILALLMLIVGVFMEMFSRMRMNQEQLLYHMRKDYYEKKKHDEHREDVNG